ncbi:hypothetical protein SNOG_00055 [Parastagonospora nodorum SN15]|uniref:Uncharacterized protein n=1 Tax=Phaeosphaeria nodorum (strain SN15 / ATCC MYA-4574 / FGSC 10173) TaxID=321614 RepID=Q0V7F9_PHANO|nr:hypothetical protein SNOG_00055 [Parastagonospora nodorum SN15]EAT91550.1 hypothetical protein SNOG_00055 [Parastagonospora nodorum SN15]
MATKVKTRIDYSLVRGTSVSYTPTKTERCVNVGNACAGPFEIERQTDLGLQLERDRYLPMPHDWSQDLTFSTKGKGPSPCKLGREGRITHNSFPTTSDGKQTKHFTLPGRIDMRHSVATSYTLTRYEDPGTTPKFTIEANTNAREFVDPVTSAKYRWVRNRRFSMLNEERYDF